MNVTTIEDILNPGNESDRLKKIADEHKWLDSDLLLDVFLIVKTGGTNFIPDEELLKDLERSNPDYWAHRIEIGKRKDFLKKMAESNYMQQLLSLGDVFKAVNIFVDHMRKAHVAKLEAATKRGSIDHQSGSSVDGYMEESQLDALTQIRESAGEMSFDAYMEGVTTYHEVTEDDAMGAFIAGCGDCAVYDSTNVGPARSLAASVVKYGTSLPQSYPVLFSWYTKILDELGVKNVKDVDVDDPRNRKRDDKMEDYDKMDQIDPSDVEREDFDVKVANKNLDVKQDIEEEEGKCHLFVLLDTSGSMMACDLGGRVCRAFAANVLTLGLLNFAMKTQYEVHVVPFAGNVARHRVQHASDRTTALEAMRWLGGQEYDGGGTNISAAMLYAYEQVAKESRYQKCDIVLITDGCSDIWQSVINDKPKKTKVRTLLCCESSASAYYGSHLTRLRQVSDSFAQIGWDNMTNMFSCGDILKGINDPHSNDKA